MQTGKSRSSVMESKPVHTINTCEVPVRPLYRPTVSSSLLSHATYLLWRAETKIKDQIKIKIYINTYTALTHSISLTQSLPPSLPSKRFTSCSNSASVMIVLLHKAADKRCKKMQTVESAAPEKDMRSCNLHFFISWTDAQAPYALQTEHGASRCKAYIC